MMTISQAPTRLVKKVKTEIFRKENIQQVFFSFLRVLFSKDPNIHQSRRGPEHIRKNNFFLVKTQNNFIVMKTMIFFHRYKNEQVTQHKITNNFRSCSSK